MPKLKVQNIQQRSMLYYVAFLAILAMICAGRHPKFSIYQPERKNKTAKLPGWQRSAWEITNALRTEPLLFSTDRSQLKRFKHLVGITLSYLVMQKSFIDIISKMAAGKTRNYGRNCMLQNLWCTYWKMKNVYDLIITFQSICLINSFLLYIHLYTFIYFLSYSQPKNMLTSSRLCWLVARHHQRDSSRFQLSPPSLHHGHGVILKVDHTVDMCFGELHLCVCVYV